MQALPPGSLLLHVGPQKTGTTAIQSALAASREVLRGHGVVYPGTRTHNGRAALAAMGRRWGSWKGAKGMEAPRAEWEALLAEVSDVTGRAVVSSEFFGEAPLDIANTVVDDLGRDRVHVLITLRSLAKVLPSSWQQYLKSGHDFEYEQWLTDVLADPPHSTLTKGFWRRHDHGAMVEHWVSVVGRDRVTVMVLDDQDRSRLFSTFEDLLGVERGTLVRPPGDRANRSLSAVECEMLRQVNLEADRQKVPWRPYYRVVRNGALLRMLTGREPGPDEPGIVTPAWVYERTAQLGAAAMETIKATDVQVVGDLATLVEKPTVKPASTQPLVLPVEAASQLVLGALSASMGRGSRFGGPVATWPPPKEPEQLADLSTGTLVSAVGRRGARSARWQVRRVARRLKRRGG